MAEERPVSRRRTAIWGLVFNYASVGVSFLSGFIVMPISLRFIPRDVYGAWLASGNVLVWLTVADPGLSAIVQQKVAEAFGGKKYSKVSSVAWSASFINAVLSVVVVLAGVLASGYLPVVLRLPPAMDGGAIMDAFTWAAAGAGVSIMAFTVASVNLGMQATVGIGVPYAVIALASVLLTVVLLFAGLGVLAAPMASVVRAAALLTWNLGYLVVRFRREGISLRPRLDDMGGLIRLALYTLASNGITTLSGNIDSFLVARMLGSAEVPVFRATRTTVESSRLLVERPFIALMPALAHLAGTGEVAKARSLLIRITTIAIWGVVLLGGGFLALNRELVGIWVGSELYGGSLVNALLCVGLVAGTLSSGLANICFSLGAIEGVSRIRAVQAFLQLAAMVGLGWWLGMAGIAAAPLLASLLIGGWSVTRLFGELVKLKRDDYRRLVHALAVSVVAAGLAIAATKLFTPGGWLRLGAVAMVFVAVYCGSLVVLAEAFRSEVRMAWGVLQVLFRRRGRFGGDHDRNRG